MLLLNTLGWSELKAQSSVVETVQAGSKVFLEINAQQLQTELNSLFNATSGAANSDWNTVLTNGSNPGMDVNFSGYDAIGFGHINADGTVTADSLVLNKDASVTGMITVDSLKVTDVIQGQISSLSNLSSDNLTEGNTNLYMTSTERSLLSSMAATLDSLIAVIDALGSGSSPTASVPAVVTDAASDVAEDAATLNGSITSDGGDAVTATGYRWGAMADLSDAQDLAGSGTSGSFTGSLTGLTAGMTYYFTAFATNAEGTAYGDTLSFETTAASAGFTTCGDNVTYQGYDYPTVAIGTLCWFKENLQAEQYNTGAAIPADLTNAEWAAATDPAAHKYSMDFGGMVYNQYAVLTGNLCPTGWHVSTHSDWTNLEDWVSPADGFPMLIDAIKSSPTDTPSWNGTNTSGFSATTANHRNRFGFVLTTAPNQAHLWTSTEQSTAYGWYRRITSDGLWFNSTADKTEGFSVRCVLD